MRRWSIHPSRTGAIGGNVPEVDATSCHINVAFSLKSIFFQFSSLKCLYVLQKLILLLICSYVSIGLKSGMNFLYPVTATHRADTRLRYYGFISFNFRELSVGFEYTCLFITCFIHGDTKWDHPEHGFGTGRHLWKCPWIAQLAAASPIEAFLLKSQFHNYSFSLVQCNGGDNIFHQNTVP